MTGVKFANDPVTSSVTIKTPFDSSASTSISAGSVGDVVLAPSFSMDNTDRVVARVTASAKLMFQTSAGGGLTYSSSDGLNAKITLIYPSGFFDTSTTPSAVISGTGLSGVTASCAHSGSTKLVVSLTAGAIPASSNVVTIAFSNLKMASSAHAGSDTGLQVQTLDGDGADYNVSPGFASGSVGDVVLNPSFSMDNTDRVVALVTASAKLMFQTSAGGGLTYSSTDALNAKITLIYPTGFFDTSTTPAAVISGTGLSGVTASCAHSGSTKLVVSLTAGTIPASSNVVTIAFSNLKMASAAHAGSGTGMQVQTLDGDGADYNVSPGFPSGSVGNMVLNPSFSMDNTDRVVALVTASAKLMFQTSAGGGLTYSSTDALNAKITLIYPTGFFDTSTTPAAVISGTGLSGVTASCAHSGSTKLVVSLTAGTIPASSNVVTIAFSNLKMASSAQSGSGTGMQVQTLDGDGSDYNVSPGFASGPVGNVVLNPSFSMDNTDRVVALVTASAKLMFQTSAGGGLTYSSTDALNAKITLIYPTGFFDTSTTPAAVISGTGLSGVTASCAHSGSTKLVVSLTAGTIPASSNVVTIAFSNLKMASSAQSGSGTGMQVQTLDGDGADYNVSPGFASGPVGNVVLNPSFSMINTDRVVALVTASAKLMFQTSAGGGLTYSSTDALNAKITLIYPTGFFDTSTTPAAVISGTGLSGVTASCAHSGSTKLVVSLTAGTIPASSNVVTIAFSNLKMASSAQSGSGAGMQVQTLDGDGADYNVSPGFASGPVRNVVLNPSFSMDNTDRVVALVTASAKLLFRTNDVSTLTYSSTDALNAKITLIYPTGFFDTSTTPAAVISGTGLSGVTASCAHSGSTKLVVSLTAGTIPASSNVVTIAFSNLKMASSAQSGSGTGMQVQTLDLGELYVSPGFASGPIAASVLVSSSIFHQFPSSGTALISVFGLGFSAQFNSLGGPTARVTLGRQTVSGTNCEATLWRSATTVLCKQPGHAPPNRLRFVVSQGDFWGFSGSMTQAISFDVLSIRFSAGSTPVVGYGLIGYYTANSFNLFDKVWNDLSGQSNHATETSGTFTLEQLPGSTPYIYGGTSAWIKFPSAILPSIYTLFYVARYNGATKGRIFNGLSSNWLSGFWNGNSGVAHHNCWITAVTDVHGTNWVMASDRANSFRSNGVERKTTNSCVASNRLSINTGETSDFAIQIVLVYDRRLEDSEVLLVENWLNLKSWLSGPSSVGPSSGSTQATVTGFSLGGQAYSSAVRMGRSHSSSIDMAGGTACQASTWRSQSAVVCKMSGGVGGGTQGLPVVLSGGLQRGSLTQAWNYDVGIVSSVRGFTNDASSGGLSVSVAGRGYGGAGVSARMRLGRALSDWGMEGGSGSEASVWVSDSGAVCKVAGGVGGSGRRGWGLPVVLSGGLQRGSLMQAWSYDAGVVSSVGGFMNGASSGGLSVSVAGRGYGGAGVSARMRVGRALSDWGMEGGSGSEASVWVSDSGAVCKVAGGVGGSGRRGWGLPVVLSGGLQRGSLTQAWSYDAGVVSGVGGLTNGPSSGGTSATVAGVSFGRAGYSGKARLGRGGSSASDMTGGTSCEASVWVSNSALRCKLGAGVGGGAPMRQGEGLPVILTFGLQQGSLTQAWSYAAGFLSGVGGLTNGPSSGGTSATVAGVSFGRAGYSGKARVGRGGSSASDMTGGTMCEASVWVSNSALRCKLGAGVGGGAPMRQGEGLPVVLTFGLQQGSLTRAWSFDSVFMSSFNSVFDIASSGGQVVTFWGVSFGNTGFSSIGRAGSTSPFSMLSSSESSVWFSESSISCKFARLVFRSGGLIIGDKRGALVITQHGGSFSRTSLFSFVPSLVKSVTNSPFTGSFLVTVIGNAFTQQGSIVVKFGHTSSLQSLWISDSMMRSRSSRGWGKSLHATLSAGRHSIIYSNVFTYDIPTISSFRANGPSSGGVVYVMLGSNFGGLQTSSRAKVGITAYDSTFVSDSSIGSFILSPCMSLPSFNLPAQVEVGVEPSLKTSGFVSFSYDPPHVSSWSATSRPIGGATSITIYGNHFGPHELTLSPAIGFSLCLAPLFVSYSTLFCKIPALSQRPSQNLDVIMGRGDQKATLSRAFTYEVPEVDSSVPASIPSSGKVMITLSGRRYSTSLQTQKVRIDNTACIVSNWVSDTSITCRHEYGVGIQLEVTVSVLGILGLSVRFLTYDAPILSKIEGKRNVATSGGIIVTIMGRGFGIHDYSSRAWGQQFGTNVATASTNSLWYSTSYVICRIGMKATGLAHKLILISSGRNTGSISNIFSYDQPTLFTVGGVRVISFTNVGTTSWTAPEGVTSIEVLVVAGGGSGGGSTGGGGGGGGLRYVAAHPVTPSQLYTVTVGAGGPQSSQQTRGSNGENSVFGSITAMGGGGGAATSSSDKFDAQNGGSGGGGCIFDGRIGAFGTGILGQGNNGGAHGTEAGGGGGGAGAAGSNAGIVGGNGGSGMLLDISGTNAYYAGGGGGSSFVSFGIGGLGGGGNGNGTAGQANTGGGGGGGFLYAGLGGGAGGSGIVIIRYRIDTLGIANSASSGSYVVSIAGSNFGTQDGSFSLRIGRIISSWGMEGGSGSEASVWVSDSGAVCKVAGGVGGSGRRGWGLPVVLSGGLQRGSLTQAWSYDAGVVSSVGGFMNGASSGGLSVSVAGRGYGGAGVSARMRLGRALSDWGMEGGSGSEASVWVSDSGAVCKVAGGVGGSGRRGWGLPVVLSGGLQRGSLTQAWSYDAGVVCGVGGLTNGPSSGGTSATVTGVSFGRAGYSGKARVGRGGSSASDMTGGTMCEASVWVSNSALRCKLGAGVGGGAPMRQGEGLPVVLTFGVQQGSLTQAWSFDAGVVSRIGGLTNGPSSSGTSATVAGVSFGRAGYSGKARLGRGGSSASDMTGGTMCEASVWVSNSALRCKLGAGVGGGAPMRQGEGLPVVLTIGVQQGSLTQAWSYDAGVVSSVGGFMNGASSGGLSVSVAGRGYGGAGLSARMRLGRALSDWGMEGGSGSEASVWVSDSGAVCKVAGGVGGSGRRGWGLPVVLSGGLQRGSLTQAWSYDAGVVSSVGGFMNGASSGGLSVSVAGRGYGGAGVSARMRLGRALSDWGMEGGSGSEASVWVSDSGAVCKVAGGVGGSGRRGWGLPVVLSGGLQRGSLTQAWSYDAGVVSSVGGFMNGASSGGVSVSVAGRGYGGAGVSARMRLGRALSDWGMEGGSGSEASVWVSDSGAVCKVAGGVGGSGRRGWGLPVVLSGGLQRGSLTQAWSYDAGVVSSVGGFMNGASSGGVSVSVAGRGYGGAGVSARMRLGRALSDWGMEGGSGSEASVWVSDSGAVCKVAGGVGGSGRRGWGLPVVLSGGLQRGSLTQAWSYDAGVCEQRGGLHERCQQWRAERECCWARVRWGGSEREDAIGASAE
jgi:hypothetical protein